MADFDFSKMKDLGKSGKDDAADDRQARDDTFRAKVSMQQFMNHNGPLFRAFAFKGVDISDVTDGNVLVRPTEDAANLTRLVAAEVMGKAASEVTPRDASFFRTEAASWVATRWLKGEPYDIAAAAHQIAAAVKLAGPDWDHDPYKDDRISGEASLMMSAAGVTATMMKHVEVYDFRMGRNEALKTVLDAVIGTSVQVVGEMLPKNASKNDIVNLIQTVSRNVSAIMEAIYERKAREVVNLLRDKKTAQKLNWLDANRPLADVVSEFKDWALCFVGFAVATSTRIAASPQSGDTPSVQHSDR